MSLIMFVTACEASIVVVVPVLLSGPLNMLLASNYKKNVPKRRMKAVDKAQHAILFSTACMLRHGMLHPPTSNHVHTLSCG